MVAADSIFHISDKFVRYFQEENSNVAGENLTVSAENQGITVSAEQVIGDAYGCYILFHIKEENVSLDTFENIDVQVEGSDIVIKFCSVVVNFSE